MCGEQEGEAGECQECPANSFNPSLGSISASACTACPLHASSAPSSSHLTNCSCSAGRSMEGDLCTACSPGKFKALSGPAGCLECQAGAFSSAEASTGCTSCPANSQSIAGSTSSADCKCDTGFGGNNCRIVFFQREAPAEAAHLVQLVAVFQLSWDRSLFEQIRSNFSSALARFSSLDASQVSAAEEQTSVRRWHLLQSSMNVQVVVTADPDLASHASDQLSRPELAGFFADESLPVPLLLRKRVTCGTGHYSPVSGGCTPCPQGTYKHAADDSACTVIGRTQTPCAPQQCRNHVSRC